MALVARSIQPIAYPTALAEVTATHAPSLRRAYEGVAIDVHLAKASGEAWGSPALFCLVEQARASYRTAYGARVVLFDEHDDKAWIYVAIAAYESQGRLFEEVLTLRFVPASGLPVGTDDLDFYVQKDEPNCDLWEFLSRHAQTTERALTIQGCYSQSRMGAVRPTAYDGSMLSGNRHIGLAWSLMLECFLGQVDDRRQRCQLLTCQTTEQLRILGSKIPTLRCDEHFGLTAGSIILNRRNPRVRELCYEFPTYFLDLKDISKLLVRLLEEGSLPIESIQAAISPGISAQRALRQPQPAFLKGLHELFSGHQAIPGSRLSGEDLRQLADAEVRDGPVLRVTQLDGLERQLEELRQQALAARPASFIRSTRVMNETA